MPFRALHSNKRLLYSRNDLAGPQHSPCAPAWTHSQQTSRPARPTVPHPIERCRPPTIRCVHDAASAGSRVTQRARRPRSADLRVHVARGKSQVRIYAHAQVGDLIGNERPRMQHSGGDDHYVPL